MLTQIRMQILIVDDEKTVRDLLCALCEREGHQVVAAADPYEALGQLRGQHFDLMITDVVMPGLDGLALVRRARAIQPELMPIVITGYTGKYTLEEVIEAGAADLMLKPFRAPELKARLKLAADQKRMLEQLKARERAIKTTSTEMIDGLQRELGQVKQTAARLTAVVTRGDDFV